MLLGELGDLFGFGLKSVHESLAWYSVREWDSVTPVSDPR